MATLIHMVVFVFCAFECLSALKDIRGQCVKLIMFAALGLIHGLVPALTPREMMWATTDSGTILMSSVLALAGVIAFALGWRLYEARRPHWDGLSPGLNEFLESPRGQRLLVRMFMFCAVLSVTAWLGAMIVASGSIGAAFTAGRFEYRATGNLYVRTMLTHMANLMAVPGFICFFMPRKYRILGITFAVTLAGLLFVGSQGARAAALGLIGSVAIGYMLRNRIAFHRVILLGAGAGAVLMLAVALYEVRKVMSRSTLGEMAEIVVSAETYQGALARDPLNYHQFLTAAVEHFPRDHGYLNGATYIRLLIFFIPQKYSGGLKPPDTHNTFARVITSYSSESTIPPTMMGDGYINFWGPPGVIVVMFLNGLLCALAARRLRESPLWFFAIGGPLARLAMLMLRGSPYEVLTLILTAGVFTFILSGFSGQNLLHVGRNIKRYNRALRNGPQALSNKPATAAVQRPVNG